MSKSYQKTFYATTPEELDKLVNDFTDSHANVHSAQVRVCVAPNESGVEKIVFVETVWYGIDGSQSSQPFKVTEEKVGPKTWKICMDCGAFCLVSKYGYNCKCGNKDTNKFRDPLPTDSKKQE